jgi:hypothetical protein
VPRRRYGDDVALRAKALELAKAYTSRDVKLESYKHALV